MSLDHRDGLLPAMGLTKYFDFVERLNLTFNVYTWQAFKTSIDVYNDPTISIARHSRRGRVPSFSVDFCYRKNSAWPHISFFHRSLHPSAHMCVCVCQDKHER